MSKEESDTYLRYGQGIIMKGYKGDADPDQGYLTVRGFADIKANYETVEDILYFKNYRNAIFEFLPAGNFQINDELQKLKSKVVDTPEEELEKNKTIHSLVPRADSERIQFELSIKSKKKNTIKFGDYIILKHIDSENYLTGTIRPSDGTNGAFSVEVTERLSRSLIFQLLPYRSFEAETMEIPFSSPVLLKNIYNNGFLTFQKLGLATFEDNAADYVEREPTASHESYRIPVKTFSKNSKIFQVVTHFVDLSVEETTPMPWQFELHFKDVNNDSLIQHDIVYLQHTENNGILSAIGEEIMLKELKNSESEGLEFYESLWEIEKHDATKKSYILRHLMSGMTLGVERGIDGEPIYAKLIDISDGPLKKSGAEGSRKDLGMSQLPRKSSHLEGPKSEIGWVDLKLAKKQGGAINSQSFINICMENYTLDLAEEEQEDHDFLKSSVGEVELINLKRMKKLAAKEIQYDVKRLRFNTDISKHCFVIQEIDQGLKKELLFALSFHSKIIQLREDLKWGATQAMKRVDYIRMMKMTEKIKQINDFLRNCGPDQEDKQFIQPLAKRQKVCKDLGLSELLFELLFFMKENMKEEIFKEKTNQREKFQEMYCTIYEVIITLIKDNKIFKILVSKWIMFVFEDVIDNNEDIFFKALIQILKNNSFFVENFVTPDLVTYLYEKMLTLKPIKSFVEKKYIDIFRAFCIVDGKVLSNNQAIILNNFVEMLEKKSDGQVYLVKFVEVDGEIYVRASFDKRKVGEYLWGDFVEETKRIDQNGQPLYPLMWEYYKAYLSLLGDMTQGRNKNVERYIQSQLPLNLLTELYVNYDLQDLQIPITDIIHYLYAENDNYYPIERSIRIVNFQEIEKRNIQVSSFRGPNSPWDEMERVLHKLLEKLQQAGPINPDQLDKNKILLSLLHFTKQTMGLGFWITRDQLETIYQCMRNILEKYPKVDESRLTKVNEENELMIACKIECLEIIDFIIDQDLQIYIQIINKVFQGYEFPQSAAAYSIEVTKLLEVTRDIEFANDFLARFQKEAIKIKPIVGLDIYEQMLQLARYGNPNLTNNSLRILKRIFKQENLKMERFYSLLYVCGENKIQFAEFLERMRPKFYILEDTNTPTVSYQTQYDNNYYPIYAQKPSDGFKEEEGLIQDMYMVNELMKNQNDLNRLEELPTMQRAGLFEILSSDHLINFTSERKSSNLVKQKLVDATNIHNKVLAYILNCKQIPQEELAAKLLHMNYKLLVGLIENHQQMKGKIVGQLGGMMSHLSQNIGLIDLLRELYDNNKNMLYNDIDNQQLIRLLCDNINAQQHTFYKAKLMDFFRYLIYLNGKTLKNNQILILKIMQDDDYHDIIFRYSSSIIAEAVAQYNEDNGGLTFPEDKVICGPDLLYMTSFFQIVMSLIDQNNTVNIGKFIKRYPFEKLVSYIQACGECWFLKRNIRGVLNRMFYFSVGTNAYLSSIINQQIPTIISDLDSYIRIKMSPDAEVFQNLRFDNPVRFTYLESYLYLNLEQNLFSLYSMFNTEEVYNDIERFVTKFDKPNQLCDNIMKILERLGCLRQYFTAHRNIYTNAIIRFLITRLKALIHVMPFVVLKEGITILEADEEDEEAIAKAIEFVAVKLGDGDIAKFYSEGSEQYKSEKPLSFRLPDIPIEDKDKKSINMENLKIKLKEVFTRKKREFVDQDEEVGFKLQKIVSALKMSRNINEKFIGQFQDKIAATCLNEEDLLRYITILININEENPDVLSEDLKSFILEVINTIFEQANKDKPKGAIEDVKPDMVEGEAVEQGSEQQLKPKEEKPEGEEPAQESEGRKEIDQWEAEDWQGHYEQITALQMSLKGCGIGKFITTLLKGNIVNNIPLANSILLCGISYLLGGNISTQNNIREELNSDSQNKVLKNIRLLITKLGTLIRKCIDEEKPKEEKVIEDFRINPIDNYDYYDVDTRSMVRKNVSEPHYTDEALYYQECIVTYRRAFKFMQLLCENNNIDNKNFIREQPDTSESINFIEIATKELRNIFQVVCDEISDVPIFILDFILEVTQIPVKDNQDALIKSSFFEDLCALPTLLEKEGELQARGFQQSTDTIDEIYQKSVQIILSNFEGNDENYFKLLDQKLDPQFLVKLLSQRLQALKISTKADFEKYIEKLTEPKTNKDGNLEAETVFSDTIIAILEIVIIFKKLKDVVGVNSIIYSNYIKQKKTSPQTEQLWTTLEQSLLHIEINDDQNKAQNIYFPRHPVFSSLSGGLRDFIMKQVKRETRRQKIVSLLGFVDGVREKCTELYNYDKCQNIKEEDMIKNYKYASHMSLFICLYMMLYYDVYVEYGTADFTSSWPHLIVRFSLSAIQAYFSLNYARIWYKLKIWSKPEPVSRGEAGVEAIVKETIEIAHEGIQRKKLEGKTGLIHKLRVKLNEFDEKAKPYYQPYTSFFTAEGPKVWDSGEFYKIAIFVIVSVVGLLVYPPLLFIHVMDYIVNKEILANIFQAIALATKSLFWVSLMGVVFTIIFCTVTFSNYMKNVYEDAVDDEMCDSMTSCILALFVSGAIGQTMDKFEMVRFVFDTIYAIFFGLLFGNIISGLMLDAFGSLREINESLDDDKSNFCYMCNMPREKMEKTGQRFQTHILERHHLWNYIFYIIALEKKDQTDYTGLEYYISQKYNLPDEQMDVSWIPDGEESTFQTDAAIQNMTKKFQEVEEPTANSIKEVDARIEAFLALASTFARP